MGEKLDRYIRWVQHVLARHDSYLLQLTIGDKGCYLYGAFGVPLAHEDDAIRAIAAALDLQSPPPEVSNIGPVQIGISYGRVRAGAYGGSMRRTYGVLGDEVNIAARLMSHAQPGQILVNPHIAQATKQAYVFEPLGPIRLKGKQEPLPVYVVQTRQLQLAHRLSALFPTPLVGRDEELNKMMALLGPATTGQGQILQIEGLAGIGKSHLIAEYIERSVEHGFRLTIGSCQSTNQGMPYYPWRQIFRTLFSLSDEPLSPAEAAVWATEQIATVETTLAQEAPERQLLTPLLGDLLDLPIPDNETTAAFDPELRQEALFALVIFLIQSWAAQRPLLITIEDAHWMDETSKELTLALSRILTGLPVLLALVFRPAVSKEETWLSEIERLPGLHLKLGELSSAGIAELVTNRIRGKADTLALSLIQTQSQGNPFFAEELVDTLSETGGMYPKANNGWVLSDRIVDTLQEANCLTFQNGQRQLSPTAPLASLALGIPDSIHGVVLSRIDRLAEEEKGTLKVASVIGRIFEFDVLAQSHPLQVNMQALLDHISTLEGRDFAYLETPAPRLSHIFKHNIIRDVVYETLIDEQRRDLHRIIGLALEQLQPEAVERLAFHFSHGADREKAIHYLDLAARKAQHEFANETALNYYSQALELDERWEWRKGQAEILHILGRRTEEEGSLRRLESHPAAPAFEVAYLWSRYFETIGQYPQAQKAIERALEASPSQDKLLDHIRALAQLGQIAYKQGNYEAANTQYNQALAHFERQQTYTNDEANALAKALNGLGIAHRQQGEFKAARQAHQRALTLSQQTGNRQAEAQAYNDLGGTAYYQRHFADALQFHQQALEIRRNIGHRAGEGTSLYNLAMTARDAGDYGQTQQYLSEALVILQATGNRWDEVNVWNELGILYHELGDLHTAETSLQRGLALSKEIGDEAGQAYVLSNLGLVAFDQNDMFLAGQVMKDGLEIARKQDDKYAASYFLSHLARVNLAAGRHNKAVKSAEQALAMRREIGLSLWITADLATLAEAALERGQETRALDYAQQALTILDDCAGEGPEMPQRDYFVCYHVLNALGRQEQAARALEAAYQLVIQRGEKITDDDLRLSYLQDVPINDQIIFESSANKSRT